MSSKWIKVSILAIFLFFISLFLLEGNSIQVEKNVYSTVLDAIQSEFIKDEIEILQINDQEKLVSVLYIVNNEKLFSELFLITNNGFQRVKESKLTVSGVPLSETNHKIRTFIVTDGPWHNKQDSFTYVTIGTINEPKDVSFVELRYRGQYKKLTIEKNSFLSVTVSNERWEELHPILFFDKSGQEIGGYMKGFLDKDLYCH